MSSNERQPQLSQPFGDSFQSSWGGEAYVRAMQSETLAPYTDDELIISRLTSPSRLFRRYPEAQAIVEEALLTNDDDSLVAASELLYEALDLSQPAAAPPVARVLSYLNMANSAANTKNRLLGEATPTARCNAVVGLVGRKIAASVTDEALDEYVYSTAFLAARIESMTQGKARPYAPQYFYETKLEALLGDLQNRRINTEYAALMPGYDEVTPSPEQITADSATTRAVFGEILANRQYGLKLGYKPHELGGSLVFGPPIADRISTEITKHKNVHPLMLASSDVATIVHSYRRSFKTLKPELISHQGRSQGFSYDRLGLVNLMYLSNDGELYCDRAGNTSVRDIFVRANKYTTYRQFQAEILAGYFDMTQPAEIVNAINRTIAPASASKVDHDPTQPMDIIHKLVVPRVRFIKQNAELVTESTVDEESATGNHRTLRFHGVTWHRRRLPDGWTPSPEARELAASAGVALRDNETFVREHQRGAKQVGEVIGHHLFQR
ncbi:MAG: hypothetical protein ABIR37_01515 [Candidatus Saccharimonadales bacterium]